MNDTPETAAMLQAGRLSQRCPCETSEAAGNYCTRCGRATGPADWFRQERGRPASGPGKTPRNGINRGPGRPRGALHERAAA